MKNICILIVMAWSLSSFSQVEDALVFLADKENVAGSIANPISILTQEAIDRKAMHGVAIDARDVPVNESYISQLKNATGITVYAKSKWMNAVYVRGTQSNVQNLENLSFVIDVEFMDPALNLAPMPQPVSSKWLTENPSRNIIYNYGAAANQVEMISADFLHELDLTGAGMIIAVMDSGFPNVNTNLAFSEIIVEGRLLGTYDFVNRQVDVTGTGSHGIKTFSDMGGFLEDAFVGTAPEASYYLFRTEYAPTENPVEEAWWVEALERADSLGVDVVNTSLGYQDFDDPSYDHSYQDLDGMTTIAARGANHAFDKGMLLVSSAGNDGNGFMFVGTPADAPGVLTVGAVDANGDYASFSSVGPTVDGRIKPDVMAQGQDAAVIDAFGNVTFNSGTSLSSPILAGAVACLWQAKPEARNYQLMDIIREAGHLYPNPSNEMGYGIPDFSEAYNNVITLGVEEILLGKTFAIYPNPVHETLYISFPKDVQTAQVTIFNVLGARIMESSVGLESNQLDLSTLNSGMYIANIRSGNNSNSFKFIKK